MPLMVARKGLLSNPTAAAQLWRQELVLMPQRRHSLSSCLSTYRRRSGKLVPDQAWVTDKTAPVLTTVPSVATPIVMPLCRSALPHSTRDRPDLNRARSTVHCGAGARRRCLVAHNRKQAGRAATRPPNRRTDSERGHAVEVSAERRRRRGAIPSRRTETP